MPERCGAAAMYGSGDPGPAAQGRFRMIKRTEGVSSTDIVGRMLMCTRDNARFREARPALLAYRGRLGACRIRPFCEGLYASRPYCCHAICNMPAGRQLVAFSVKAGVACTIPTIAAAW